MLSDFQKTDEFIIAKFQTIVKTFNLFLDHSLSLLKCCRHITLVLQEERPNMPRKSS